MFNQVRRRCRMGDFGPVSLPPLRKILMAVTVRTAQCPTGCPVFLLCGASYPLALLPSAPNPHFYARCLDVSHVVSLIVGSDVIIDKNRLAFFHRECLKCQVCGQVNLRTVRAREQARLQHAEGIMRLCTRFVFL